MCESDLGPSMKGAGVSVSSQQRSWWMLGYKQCGSSLADVSDKDLPTQNFTGFEGGPFVDDGLLHPPRPGQGQGTGGSNTPGRSIFRPREILGTPAPVFLPEQRNHRVNGLFTNNSRSLQPLPETDRQLPSPRLPPVLNSLRSGSQRRPPVAKFSTRTGQPNNFDFSRLSSATDGQSYEMHPLTPRQQQGENHLLIYSPLAHALNLTTSIGNRASRQNQREPIAPFGPPAVLASQRRRGRNSESDESFNQSLVDSPFLRLIPLDEARKISASHRENAPPNLNVPGALLRRDTRNVSTVSNAGTAITEPAAVAAPPISRFTPRAIANRATGKESQAHP